MQSGSRKMKIPYSVFIFSKLVAISLGYQWPISYRNQDSPIGSREEGGKSFSHLSLNVALDLALRRPFVSAYSSVFRRLLFPEREPLGAN